MDFGKEWYNIPCTNQYWETVNPIFEMLNLEKEKGTRWSSIADKEQRVYIPLLQAFIDEVRRHYLEDQQIPQRMVEYLIGVKDYYKIVSKDSKHLTLIYTFNLHGTLNKHSKNRISIITVPIVELPTRLVALEFKPNSNNTIGVQHFGLGRNVLQKGGLVRDEKAELGNGKSRRPDKFGGRSRGNAQAIRPIRGNPARRRFRPRTVRGSKRREFRR